MAGGIKRLPVANLDCAAPAVRSTHRRPTTATRGRALAGRAPNLGRVPTVLPALDVEKVKRFCAKKVPANLADEVSFEVTTRANSVSIHERRPLWRGASRGVDLHADRAAAL